MRLRAAGARLGRVPGRLGGLAEQPVTGATRHPAKAAAAVALGAAVAAAAIIAAAPPQPGGAQPASPAPAAAALAPARPLRPVRAPVPLPASYTGVYQPTGHGSYAPAGRSARLADSPPAIRLTYSGWRQGFPAAFAGRARAAGAVPFVQIEPGGVRLAAIARGSYDSYLRRYADAVAAYGDAVLIGFGPEMNEPGHSRGPAGRPAAFVRAWRHIAGVFRAQNADNVTWVWTIGKTSAAARPDRDSWPGARYVSWVAVDGYYSLPGRGRRPAFAATIAAVRRITSDPVLLFGDR